MHADYHNWGNLNLAALPTPSENGNGVMLTQVITCQPFLPN